MYQFEENSWKEAGLGVVTLLTHEVTGIAKLRMECERPAHRCIETYIISHPPYCELRVVLNWKPLCAHKDVWPFPKIPTL